MFMLMANMEKSKSNSKHGWQKVPVILGASPTK